MATPTYPHTASADTRHTCATHNYERGMTLWEVQKVLGHDWATTTLQYMNPRELHQTGEKPQVARSRRGVEGLRRHYELAA